VGVSVATVCRRFGDDISKDKKLAAAAQRALEKLNNAWI
jgi:hypothetical protein